MAKFHGAILVDTDRCKGCNLCVVACPTGAISLTSTEVNRKGYSFCTDQHPEQCIGCAACAIVCPDACIQVFKCTE